MRKLILRHETRSLLRSRWLVGVMLLLVMATGFATWSGSNGVQRQIQGGQAINTFEDGLRARMYGGVVKYAKEIDASGGEYKFAPINHAPGRGAPQGTNAGAVGSETQAYAILPPTDLGAMSVGQSDILLSYFPVNMRNIFDASRELELENPVNLQTGAFDIAFVIIFLLPIFILAMSYNLLSSEKERGTLAMVMSNPASLGQLLMAKLYARARILLTLITVLGLVSMLSAGAELGNIQTWVRFAFWLIATLLYGLFWFVLAVLINLVGKSSAANGILLAGSWLILVVIVPTIISIVATTTYPAPSRMDLTVAARQAQTQAEASAMKALDQYYYDHMELVPAEKARDFLTLSIANSEAIEKSLVPVYAGFNTQLKKQDSLVKKFQFSSPAIMMQLSLNEVSGTSADRHENFMRQVFEFHDEWKEYFSVRFLKQTPLRPEDYAQFPAFEYEEEPMSTIVARLIPSIVGLLLLLLLTTFLTIHFMRRYQIASR